MNVEQFESIFQSVMDQSKDLLVTKAREYASDSDRLHNFHAAAGLIGGTPEQALWGFMVKHLVSLSDMIASGNQYSDNMWEEKIGDSLNYLILLRAVVYETNSKDSFHAHE